jgi:hypothetical protein
VFRRVLFNDIKSVLTLHPVQAKIGGVCRNYLKPTTWSIGFEKPHEGPILLCTVNTVGTVIYNILILLYITLLEPVQTVRTKSKKPMIFHRGYNYLSL